MTNRTLATPMLGALFFGILATVANADPALQPNISLSDAYIREMPPNAPVAGGYVTIANGGAQDDRLISASSPLAGRVQIHEMTMKGDVMKMRTLPDGLTIPAGATVAMTPGGYHLMFLQVPVPFAEGQTVPTTLIFQNAGRVELPFKVHAMRAAPAGQQGRALDHSGH